MSSFLGILLLCCVWQGSHGTGKNEFGLAVQTAQIARSYYYFALAFLRLGTWSLWLQMK